MLMGQHHAQPEASRFRQHVSRINREIDEILKLVQIQERRSLARASVGLHGLPERVHDERARQTRSLFAQPSQVDQQNLLARYYLRQIKARLGLPDDVADLGPGVELPNPVYYWLRYPVLFGPGVVIEALPEVLQVMVGLGTDQVIAPGRLG